MGHAFKLRGGGGGSGASLIFSAPAGAIITVSKDGKSKTKTADSAGAAKFTGLSTGVWAWSMRDASHEATTPSNVEITADYYITAAFFAATIAVTYPEGSTCTCSDGVTTLAAVGTTGSYTFTVPNTGEWTVSCTDGSSTAGRTVSITEEGQSESVILRYGIDLINGSDITGGWSVGYKDNSTPTITTEVDKITVSCNSTDVSFAHICTAVTKNLIDFSECTKITVNVTSVKVLSAGEIRIGLVKNRTSSSLVSSVKITGKGEYSLSITPGSYYVAIYVKGDNDGEVTGASNITVNKLVAS